MTICSPICRLTPGEGSGGNDSQHGSAPYSRSLTDERLSDERWLFERKLEGIRSATRHRGARRPS
jgi:hypothetical protein